MEGKRRVGKKKRVEDGMMVPLVPFPTCLLPLKLLLEGSFHQQEVKQPNHRVTQRPNKMNYLVPSEEPDHLALSSLSWLSEQWNHLDNKFSRMSSLYNYMLVVHDGLSAMVVEISLTPTTASADTRSLCMTSLTTERVFATSPCGERTIIEDIILNQNMREPAPGRGQTSIFSIENLLS